MTKSPMMLGLKRRFSARPARSDPDGYRRFTTDFDELVDADHLTDLVPMSARSRTSFEAAVTEFETVFTAERVRMAASGSALIRDLQASLTPDERNRTVVSFLIDHSGSMRGLRMMAALLAVEEAVDALSNAGIATEILGFTTASWKGGRSRAAWRWAGRPRNPGRLCDLRHIVYGSADRTVQLPWTVRVALRPDILHENVDGEALAWSAGRLHPDRWSRRVLCLVSDGAPVDDSTLQANDDSSILVRHLEDTQHWLLSQGFVVGSLLIGGEPVREPTLFERAEEPQTAALSLLHLVRRALLPAGEPLSQMGPTG